MNDNSKKSEDPVYKVRPLIDSCNELFKKYNIPGKKVNIDETMIKYKGRLKFRQFISSKPVKYGIKCFLICNSITSYCYGITVYTGKGTTNKIEGMSMTESLILNMVEPYLNEFRILYVDNYFNTIKLSNYLLKNKTGLVGTFRKNRNAAKSIIQFPNERFTYDIYINYPDYNLCMIYCYDSCKFLMTTNVSVPKATVKKKNNRTKKTLDVIQDYNKYARGVDLCNQQTTLFRYSHGSKKWWKPLCFHIFQLIVYNSYILYKNYKKDLTLKEYYKIIILKLLGEDPEEKKNIKLFHPIGMTSRKNSRRRKCMLCESKTYWKCTKCSTKSHTISLCLPDCYNKYHMNL